MNSWPGSDLLHGPRASMREGRLVTGAALALLLLAACTASPQPTPSPSPSPAPTPRPSGAPAITPKPTVKPAASVALPGRYVAEFSNHATQTGFWWVISYQCSDRPTSWQDVRDNCGLPELLEIDEATWNRLNPGDPLP